MQLRYQSLQKYIEAKTILRLTIEKRTFSLLFSLQQITDLKKENFNLKLRIYFMEERMQQRLGDGDDVFKIVRCTTKFPSNMFLIETDGGGKTLEFVKHLFQAFQYS